MSNIGKQRILLPRQLKVQSFGWKVEIEGPYGKGRIIFPPYWSVAVQRGALVLKAGAQANPCFYGCLHQNLGNLAWGLSIGYTKKINLVGVGYRGRLEGNILVLRLGYSSEKSLKLPTSVNLTCTKPNLLKIQGTNLEEVHQFVAVLRGVRPPDPYKGKGVVAEGEVIQRKQGKKNIR
jgi:large subunit ribosomal protein L6